MKINYAKFQLITYAVLAICFFSCFALEACPITKKQTRYVLEDSDSISAQKVIIKFLQWYKLNINEANSFPILIKDSENNYMVNPKAVIDYLNFIESSNCISPKYIMLWQNFFDNKAVLLKKDKIQSDIPEDFDFDFVLITQEPDLILNQLSDTRFKVISKDKKVALISMFFPEKEMMTYEFEMSKTNGSWQIDYISTSNFD